MRLKRALIVLILILAVSAGGGVLYLRQEIAASHGASGPPVIINIPPGAGVQEILQLLREHDVIRNKYAALAHILIAGVQDKLRAGEYQFDLPMTIPEVVNKLVAGEVVLYKFVVPEGLTLAETASKWEEQGFGGAADFLNASKESVALVRDLDAGANSLEGYLFPETYLFPRGATAKQAVEAMVQRFRLVVAQLQEKVSQDQWPLDLPRTVVLASLIEAEAAHHDERPVIASVYLNRLRKNILLQCDPTVIYALERANQYKGRLTYADLKFDSPYNTYRYPGLPPGAIANPGYESLKAAVAPASSPYLYFVRTDGGRHAFSESLAAHHRAVGRYRALQRRGN